MAITIADIVTELTGEVARITDTQAALVAAGMRTAPDPGMTRRADLFIAAADMLARIEPHVDDVRRIINPRRPGAPVVANKRKEPAEPVEAEPLTGDASPE